MTMDLSKLVDFQGADWLRLKSYLEGIHKTKIRQLVGSADHDKSNVLRGEIKLIEHLLGAEEAARKAAISGQIL